MLTWDIKPAFFLVVKRSHQYLSKLFPVLLSVRLIKF